MELYPGVKISIGPPIENGFYYDFEFPDGRHASPTPTSRASRRRCASTSPPTSRSSARTSPVDEALERFRAEGQDYKVELIEDLVRRRQGVETVSLYTNGPFTDLCRGPHVPGTKRIGAFKLQSVAGAYWRGDAAARCSRASTAPRSSSKKELDGAPRAARAGPRARPPQLGRELDLFTFSEVSPGLAVLAAEGHALLNAARRAEPRGCRSERGYDEVRTPLIYDASSGRAPATGTTTRRTCSSPSPRTASSG